MFSLLQTGLPVMERDTLSIAADISLVLIGVFAIIGSVFGIWMMIKVGRLSRQLGRLGHRLSGQSDPLLIHGRGIAANVEFITAALRTDVQSLSGSVHALSDRLQQASDRMEERIEEFNALMEVVQGEAEEMFLDTASTVRGVQASAADLVGGRRDRSKPATDLEPVRPAEPAGVPGHPSED